MEDVEGGSRINPTKPYTEHRKYLFFFQFIKPWCNETIFSAYNATLTIEDLEIVWASVVSIYLVGGVIGSLIGAWIADKWGRYNFIIFFLFG